MSAMVALDDQYGAVIRSLVPINGLAQKYQHQVLAQAEALDFERGQYVFREGDRDAYAFFLLDGELDLISKGSLVKHIKGGSEDATHALAQLQPRQLSARASNRVCVLRLDRKVLDRFLVLDGGGQSEKSVEVSEIDSGDDGDWMTRMLQSELFSRVPAANIQRIFTKMEHIDAKAGDQIVHQGAPGDYYYVIQAGRAEVVRTAAQGRQSVRLAELSAGDSFGEEALVSNSRRNASIVMLTDGELMRLTKEDFIELIKDPLLTDVDYERASGMIEDGAVWLDVRFSDEFEKESLPDSINVPLNVLRLQSEKLAPERRYICCCDSGTRSSVAAFLLAERGFDACFLRGGLLEYSLIEGMGRPEEPAAPVAVADAPEPPPAPQPDLDLEIDDSVGDVVPFPPSTQLSAPVPASQQSEHERTLSGVRVRHEEHADSGDSLLQADVKAQALAAELAKASMQLEEARKIKLEAEAASEAAAEAAKRELAEERKRLEQALKKQRAQEAEKARREAEKARKEAEAAASKQLETERRKLAEAAKKARQEQAEAARAEAEKMLQERLDAERQKLEVQAREAEDTWNEARRLKEELEEAKRSAQEEADKRHREQEERIQRMQREAEERLREEEARLEQSYAWQAEELARLQQLKEEAEAELNSKRSQLAVESEEAQQRLAEARRIQQEVEQTREEAAQEAEQRHQRQIELERKLREEVQEKMQSERRKLEAEFARNAEELERARREREAAEAARVAAAEEAERIVAEYRASHSEVRAQEEARLAAERARLEAEAKQIDVAREEAGRAREDALRIQREAEEQAKELMTLRAQLSEQRSTDVADQLASELKAAEDDITAARANVAAAEAAQLAAEAAHETNVENMQRQESEESSVKARFEDEIAEWIATQEVEENSPQQQQILANQREHLERIKRRAQAAREAAKNHDQSLIDELSQQLRKEITD